MINGKVHITIFGLQNRVSSLTHGFGPTVEIQEIPKIRIVSSLHARVLESQLPKRRMRLNASRKSNLLSTTRNKIII